MPDIEAGEANHVSGSRNMSDEAFLCAMEEGTMPNSEFRHFDHIRLAWIFLESMDETHAAQRITVTLRNFASKTHSDPSRYHETITRAFMRLVATSRDTIGSAHSFDEFIARFPQLLKKDALEAYYTKETLMSSAARAAFVAPDLQPLP
ncbi:MAG TPA: hypothetical protein VM099_06705 [Gemmatimonadaceae bacterium]|nr:hypothetical protein [Gemmatimonadaceae bacterium]